MEPVCVSLNQHIVMNPNCVYLTEQTSQVNIAAKGKYSDLFNQPLCVNEPKMCKWTLCVNEPYLYVLPRGDQTSFSWYLDQDVPLVEFKYLVFTRMSGESYRRRQAFVVVLVWRLSSAD